MKTAITVLLLNGVIIVYLLVQILRELKNK